MEVAPLARYQTQKSELQDASVETIEQGQALVEELLCLRVVGGDRAA